MANLTGQTLNYRYQMLESLGRGGMAEVYKVWDTQRGTHLAMKILREDLAEDRVFLRRFQREAHNLARLQHPNIVRFYGMEQQGRLAFILMDYIQGNTLRAEIFDAASPLPVGRILPILQPVCSALHYAHQQGIVHCDLKSANIMLDANGKVYLTDFGIARMSDAATATLVGVGTPAYMAPELVKGMDPSPQTDIYALGVVLYELLTGGERPFTGEKASITGTTAEKVRWEQLNQTPVSPRVYNPAIPGALENVVLRCLDKETKKRYPDALELLNALQAAVPRPAPEPQLRRGASQATDQSRKRTTGPESARSGKFEDGVYREAAPDEGESAPQHAPEMGQAAASKQPPSGKRVSAGKHFNSVLVFICAMGLLGLIASISSAQMNRREGRARQANESAAYEATATAEYNATAPAVNEATATVQVDAVLDMIKRIQQNASEYDLDSFQKEFELVQDPSDDLLECEFIADDLTDFILEVTFTNPGDDSKGWDYGILFRQYSSNDQYRLSFYHFGYWDLDNVREGEFNEIQSADFSALRTGIYGTNRVRLVVTGSEGYLFINEVYEGRLDLSSRLSAGKIRICTDLVNDSGSDGNIIRLEAVRLWEIP